MNYVKINPSGNITLLVTDPVPRERQSETATRLMNLIPDAEQVGFLERAVLPGAAVRLQMMGGEFCGNATMSMAAYLAEKENLPGEKETVFPLEVSGCRNVIPCRIVRKGSGYTGTVPMPLPRMFTEAEILPGVRVPRVCFEGIDHLIVPEELLCAQQAENMIAVLCAGFGVEALGMLLLGKDAIRPLVYVRSTNSSVWENSCGSGTAAVGAWQAFALKQDVCLQIAQPYPDTRIGVFARYESGVITGLEITGGIRIEESCEVQI